MDNSQSSLTDEPSPYRIKVYGLVYERWISRYWDMTAMEVQQETGVIATNMSGEVVDQAALVGLINMLYDLGHAIISVERLTADQVTAIAKE